MDIEKQTKSIMLTAISNFAKEYEVSDLDLQLMIKASDDEGTPIYQVFVNYKESKSVKWKR